MALLDVIFSDDSSFLYMAFEFMHQDLKKFLDERKKMIPIPLIKVSI